MPAIISSSPTAWDPLKTDLTPFKDSNVLNRFEEGTATSGIDGQDFLTFPQELDQFIQLAMAGWGAQLGSGVQLGYWSTVALIQNFLTAHIGAGVPTRS